MHRQAVSAAENVGRRPQFLRAAFEKGASRPALRSGRFRSPAIRTAAAGARVPASGTRRWPTGSPGTSAPTSGREPVATRGAPSGSGNCRADRPARQQEGGQGGREAQAHDDRGAAPGRGRADAEVLGCTSGGKGRGELTAAATRTARLRSPRRGRCPAHRGPWRTASRPGVVLRRTARRGATRRWSRGPTVRGTRGPREQAALYDQLVMQRAFQRPSTSGSGSRLAAAIECAGRGLVRGCAGGLPAGRQPGRIGCLVLVQRASDGVVRADGWVFGATSAGRDPRVGTGRRAAACSGGRPRPGRLRLRPRCSRAARARRFRRG